MRGRLIVSKVKDNSYSVIIVDDKQRKDFERKVKDWVANKISYDELLAAYPDLDEPVIEKIVKYFIRILVLNRHSYSGTKV